MRRRDALALIDVALAPEEGKRTLKAKSGIVRAPGPSQRLVDPRIAAVRVLEALQRAGVLVVLEDE